MAATTPAKPDDADKKIKEAEEKAAKIVSDAEEKAKEIVEKAEEAAEKATKEAEEKISEIQSATSEPESEDLTDRLNAIWVELNDLPDVPEKSAILDHLTQVQLAYVENYR